MGTEKPMIGITYHRWLGASFVIVVVVWSIGLATAPGKVEKPKILDCPHTTCPSFANGSSVQFRVDGGSSETTYRWTVSTGSIVGPNNRKKLRVAQIPNGYCEATVRLTGVPSGCQNDLTCSTIVGPVLNSPPSVTVSSSRALITLPCPKGTSSITCDPRSSRSVDLTALATDADNDRLVYRWTVDGGKIEGQGRPTVKWKFSVAGTYTAQVEVNDGVNHAEATVTVRVVACASCVRQR
jgi:hypothetical protein